MKTENTAEEIADSDAYDIVVANLKYDPKSQDSDWKNRVASDLNNLIQRAAECVVYQGRKADFSFAKSVIRICRLVAESEEIKTL